jgi:2-keto-4-pentenoate hydratase/2-oxohepta-3-ene-1,7-dioic acid hydratase in catechol pathway
LAPIIPVNVYGIGLNYRAHAEETGAAIPASPVIFMKPTTAITDPGEPIILPNACEHGPEVDYEAELAVVIGRTARDVSVASALDYVLGYTCANDISARRWQKEGGAGQWIRGKSFDGFCPLGPVLVTADEIPDPQALSVTCTLNGERVQTGHTSDMIFTIAELIAFLSRDTTLLPGTLIITGTPPGCRVCTHAAPLPGRRRSGRDRDRADRRPRKPGRAGAGPRLSRTVGCPPSACGQGFRAGGIESCRRLSRIQYAQPMPTARDRGRGRLPETRQCDPPAEGARASPAAPSGRCPKTISPSVPSSRTILPIPLRPSCARMRSAQPLRPSSQ